MSNNESSSGYQIHIGKENNIGAEPYQYVNISHGKNSSGYQMQENVKICIFGEFLALLHCSQDAYCHSSAPQSRWMEFLSTSTKEKNYDLF